MTIKDTISLSVIPAFIVIEINLNPDKSQIVFIKLVFPQPVSPINITGIFDFILNKIKIILKKLSAVKVYEPIFSLID